MPGISCTVGEQIEALSSRVAGEKVAARIRRSPDELVRAHRFGLAAPLRCATRQALGFKAEVAFDDIIRAHIEDELGGKVAG